MRACDLKLGLAIGVLLCAPVLGAAEPVLARVAAGGKLVIAHRESSVPFSYLNVNKQPVGYAMDICLMFAEAIRKKTRARNMPVEYLLVTPSNRISMVAEGKADMECGSTTNNAERREKVAFTIPHFITGARLLARSDSPATRIEDLRGKKIVSTQGTTPLRAAIQANKDRLLNVTILEAPDHAKGVEMVEKGEADAFVMDDVLLYGLVANRPNPGGLKVVGRFLTTEALAVMLPKNDPEFKQLIDDEMRRLIASGDIHRIYDKWFLKPIPPNQTALDMPMSYLLKDFWKYPSDFVPL